MRELQRAYVSLYALVLRVGAREGAALLLLLLADTYKAMNYIYIATSAYYAHGTENYNRRTPLFRVGDSVL